MSGVDMRGIPVNDEPLPPTWPSYPSSNTPRCTSPEKNLDPERGDCRQKGRPKGGGTGASTPLCCKRGSAPGGVRRRARSSPGWHLLVVITVIPRHRSRARQDAAGRYRFPSESLDSL